MAKLSRTTDRAKLVAQILRDNPIRSRYIIDPFALSVDEIAVKIVTALREFDEKANAK